MHRLQDSVAGHPRVWLAAIAAVTLVFAAALPRLEVRTDGAAIHPRNSAAGRATDADRARFHDPQSVIVLVRARDHGPAVASAAGWAFYRAVHDSLARLPGVRGDEIRSLVSWPDPRATHAALAAGRALDRLPTSDAEAEELAGLLRRDPLVRGLLLSDDGRVAALEVPFDDALPRRTTLAGIDRWIRSQSVAPLRIDVLGPVVAEVQLGERVLADLARLVPIMVGLIATLLAVALRTPGGVIVPLTEALLVVVWTLGAMAICRVPVTLVTTIMPVVLMSMAITDEIHFLERMQVHLAAVPPQQSARAAVVLQALRAAMDDVRGPIVATSLTTAIGFFSFFSSTLIPLRDFGIFTGFGLLCAMLLTFTLVPALTVVLPAAWFRARGWKTDRGAPREAGIARYQTRAALAGLVLLAAACAGIPRLQVEDAWVGNFDPHSELVQAEGAFNAHFWGSYRWDIVIENDPGFFFRPAGMALLERVETAAAGAPGVGGVTSGLAPLAREAALLGTTARLSTLDAGRLAELVALAQMTQERSGILQLITPDGSAARVRVHLNSADYSRTLALRRALDAALGPILAGERWHASGDLPVALDVVHAIVGNQIRSAGWAVGGIALLLGIGFRRIDVTLVALTPVTAAAALLFGAMGWWHVPLGIATSMFASLSIGVGIDFALHLMHHYKEARVAGSAHDAAVIAAIATTGRAIRWNALVLSLSLLVLCFSGLRPDRMLGLLLAAAVLSCWLTTLLFLPALLRRVRVMIVLACMAISLAGRAEAASAVTPSDPGAAHNDPKLERVFADAEAEFRRLPRAMHLQIATQFTSQQGSTRALWGVVASDAHTTHMLYVFTKPDPLRGMSLLLQDAIDPAQPDSSWLYMPSMKYFGPVESDLHRIMVPGTALTNDDARGFIPTDRYDFALADSSAAPGSGKVLRVVAVPKTAAIRDQVGYARLAIRIDEKRRLVERVEFTGVDGKPLKTYELLDRVQVRGIWLPRRVRVRHLVLGFVSDVAYDYWPLGKSPDAALFRPAIAAELFLPRLERVLASAGCQIEAPAPEPVAPAK